MSAKQNQHSNKKQPLQPEEEKLVFPNRDVASLRPARARLAEMRKGGDKFYTRIKSKEGRKARYLAIQRDHKTRDEDITFESNEPEHQARLGFKINRICSFLEVMVNEKATLDLLQDETVHEMIMQIAEDTNLDVICGDAVRFCIQLLPLATYINSCSI